MDKMNNLNVTSKQQLIKKIIEKKEFSKLPKKDVEMAFEQFDKDRYLDIEKIKLTRDLLRKIFSGFTSQKILSLKNKDVEWILRKHLSTRERLPHYKEIYSRIFKNLEKQFSVIDLGAGINGFSYNYIENLRFNFDYLGVEAVGQLVDLMNFYFKNNKVSGKAIHLSLFELEKIKQLIKKTKKPRIVFLFKTLDSLEMLKKDYSKKLLSEITPLVDRIVVSFATKSMLKRTRFKVNRKWIIDFIKENFDMLDDFEIGGERYFIFKNKLL